MSACFMVDVDPERFEGRGRVCLFTAINVWL